MVKVYRIALLACIFISSSLAYAQTMKIHQIRSLEYPYIKAEFSVSHITPVENLDESNFHVYENEWMVSSFHVKKIEPEKDPKNILTLVDSSESISLKSFNAQKKAIKIIARQLNQKDRMSLISFNDTVKKECSFLAKGKNLFNCVDEIKRNGKDTVLYDSLYESISLASRDSARRHVIVLFTDGFDEHSVVSLEDLIRYMQIHSVPVFIFSMGDRTNLGVLKKISRISGGRLYITPEIENLPKAGILFNQLLQNTYLLKYSSKLPEIPSDHKINLKIKLNSDEFSIEDEKEFYLSYENYYRMEHYMHLLQRPEYIAFGIGILIILLIFILMLYFSRRSKLKIELSEQSLKAFENTIRNASSAPPIAPQKQYLPEKPRVKTAEHGSKDVSSQKSALNYYYAYLLEKEGPKTGSRYLLKWDIIIIGRNPDNSISIDDATISDQHAKIRRDEKNRFFIYDLLSDNGVFINDKKLLRPKELNDFDEIQLGRTKLIFRKASA